MINDINNLQMSFPNDLESTVIVIRREFRQFEEFKSKYVTKLGVKIRTIDSIAIVIRLFRNKHTIAPILYMEKTEHCCVEIVYNPDIIPLQ